MAAYQYHDWASQASAAARLERLRLHMGEVSALIRPDVTASGYGINRQRLVDYHNNLRVELREAERAAAAERRGGILVTRGKPI